MSEKIEEIVEEMDKEEEIMVMPEEKKRFRNWQIYVTLISSVLYFCYYLGRYNYGVTVPFIQAELKLSNLAIGMIGTVLTLGYALGQSINGFLIDRIGPRIMMTAGAFLSTFMNFCMGLGESFNHLLISWFGNGYVQAMGYGSSLKLYANWFKKRDRGKQVGFNEGLQSLGSTLIVPIAAAIVLASGWRNVYFLSVLPLSFVAIVYYLTIKNTPAEKGFTVEWAKNVDKGSFFTNLVNAYKWALSDWRMIFSYISYGGAQFSRFVVYSWVPLYIYNLSGEIIKAGWITAFFPIGGVIGSIVYGYLSDRFTKRYPLILGGMGISAVSLIVFAYMPTASTAVLSMLMFMVGIGIESVEVGYFLLPMDVLDDKDQHATGIGCMNAMGKLFASFQGVLFGGIVDVFAVAGVAFSGFQPAFLVTAVIAFLSALAVIPIRK